MKVLNLILDSFLLSMSKVKICSCIKRRVGTRMSTSPVDSQTQFIFCRHVLTVKGQFMITMLLNAIYKIKSVKIKV